MKNGKYTSNFNFLPDILALPSGLKIQLAQLCH